MKDLKTTFVLSRETKGTYRYDEEGPEISHMIGALYIKKSAAGIEPAQKIVVTVRGL